MKKPILALVCFSLLLLNACGGKSENKDSDAQQTPRAAVIDDTQGATPEDVTTPYDLTIGGHKYHIEVHRYSDTEGKTFADDFGDEFYDNRINIRISRDTALLVNREFTINSFDSYIPNKYKGKVILQGLAPNEDKCTAAGFVFGVAIGDAGTDESRVLLVLTIAPSTGSIDIRKDDAPDTIGTDQKHDE